MRQYLDHMSVKEITSEIERLPKTEFFELVAWIVELHHRKWDLQIEEDLRAGRLDAILAKVDADCAMGYAKPL